MLANCASAPVSRHVIENGGESESGMKTLQARLPGVYSNFAWSQAQAVETPVTDLRIRQLKTDGEPVFLFEQYVRDQDIYSYDLYWLKLNRKNQQPEFFFSHLDEDELSLPMQDTLTIAWQRVLPGCVMPLEHAGDKFTAATDPTTCMFADPLRGKTRLSRRLSTDGDTMTLETGLGQAGNRKTGDDLLLQMQKHRIFTGTISIRKETVQQEEPGAWQLSQVFQLRDDGRVNQIYDQEMALMDFGLQLSRLHRFDGEPDYYKLSVVNPDSGQTQAYQWFNPGSTKLNLNLDWVKADLMPIQPEESQP